MAMQKQIRKCLAILVLCCLLAPSALADNRTYYEVFVASFYDSNGDGTGDLPGVQAQLDYLDALGVQGLWLMPIHPSPSYHKYNVNDYVAVDPAYGTVEDVAALADAMHERDMTLLLDLVINHSSSEHPWFLSAIKSLPVEPCGEAVCTQNPLCRAHNPYVDYYHFSDTSISGWRTVPGASGWWYEAWFDYTMPDLNLDNEALRADILDICRFWFDQGVDGFRLDAILHYYGEDVGRNNAFLAWFMESLRAMKPDVYVVGEAWKDAGTIAQYYDSGISALFNFPFSGAEGEIVAAIRNKKGASFAKKAEAWQAMWSVHPGASDAPFLSNHDNARIAGTLMRKTENLKMAASMYLTLPGTPFLYYGEEIGMTGSGRDENKRLPMLWDTAESPGYCLPPRGADQEATFQGSVAEQLADPDSLLSHYQSLLALRKAHSALRNGVIAVIDTGNPAVCAYTLTDDTEVVYVLHNLGKADATVEIDGVAVTLPSMTSLISPGGLQ